VDWAEPNLPLQGGAAVTDDPNFGQLWGLRNTGQTVEGSAGVPGVDVNVLPAWDTTRGAGIVVAVVDSGVAADHPDLQGNLWTNSGETPGNGVDDDDNGLVDDVRGWDFWDWDNDPDDFHSHGTHIAGTLAARANNQTGIAGVAPEAKVMPVRVLNDSNRGRTADLANGIAYAALNGADVINMSIGTPPLPDFPLPEVERDALDLAAANDALVVVAAMNDSKNNDTGHTPTWPCNFTHPNLICVAALDSDGSLSDFSNYGAVSVDVGAPGRSILSLSPDWDRLTPPGVEGFESDIAGRWYGNGSWARTTTFAASQAFSVTDSPAGNYANDTTPWIAMTNGVDLIGRQGCRINYAVRGQVLDGDLFVTGALNQWGSGYVATADTLETHGQFETWSDGISALDGDASARAVFELITDSSGTADGAFVDDVRFICRASNYDADSYFFNEGTSMATPHVAGVAALVRAAVPAASAAQVAVAIREGAVPMPSLAGKTVTGGRADAAAAIAAARRLTQPLEPQPSGPDNPGNPGSPDDTSDRTPPRARVGRASVRGPFLLLSLSFPNEPGTVTGSVNLAKLQRGSARFQARPGRAVVVKVRLRPAARRPLASGARARAVLTIRARDTAGNSSVTRSRIRLRAP
jgi:subtilisin family serine protease